MSTLKTHDLKDICSVVVAGDESPGSLVRHVDDSKSCGIVVACDHEENKAKNTWATTNEEPQVTVLWSREPKQKVSVTPVNAQSRKLNAKWSPQPTSWSQEYQGEFYDPGKHDKELEQDIIHGVVSMKEAMDRDRDIKDIVMHHSFDGDRPRLEFKRWSHEERRRVEPMIYDGTDGRIKTRGRW